MKKTYFTITGISFHYGNQWLQAGFLTPGLRVHLTKEPDNEYDSEAIKVSADILGQIGYVANSTSTVLGESSSAGRIYDRFDDCAEGVIVFVTPKGVICEFVPESAE